jgi:hypothetical protein
MTTSAGDVEAPRASKPSIDPLSNDAPLELFRVHRLHHGIEPSALIPALGAADAGILVYLNDLPTGSLRHRLAKVDASRRPYYLAVVLHVISGSSENSGKKFTRRRDP